MATVTRAELFMRASRRIGSRTGTVLSGTDSQAILGGLINTTGDDLFYQADRLIFPLAAAEADKERFVDIWTDQEGKAQFQPRSVLNPANEPYILANREDYTLNEIRLSLDAAQSYARPTYRQVIPLTPNLDLYPLTMCDWLQGAGDIDAVWVNNSPVLLHNEDFALWHSGTAAVPDGWSLTGTGASVARITGGLRSPFAARVTAGGTAARLEQALPQSLVQWLTRRIAAVFVPLRGAGWTVGAHCRVGINDGTTDIVSADNTGSGAPEYLAMSMPIDPSQKSFTFFFEVDAGHTADIDAGVFMQNTATAPFVYQIRDQGSQAYIETQLNYAKRNVGGVPTIELQRPLWTPMQLVVYVRRPFPAQTADTDVVDDQYARVLEYGLLNFLLRNRKPQQDRGRLDLILFGDKKLGEDGVANVWARYLDNLIDRPVPRPPVRREVWGA